MANHLGSIDDCCHVWAQRSQDRGESGNVFFNTDAIYSYGYHFPMAKFAEYDGRTVVLFNSDSYSNSTSGQQSKLRQATSHYSHYDVSTEMLKCIIDYKHVRPRFKKEFKKIMIKDIQYSVKHAAINASKRRKESLKAYDINEATTLYNDYAALCEMYKMHMPVNIKRLVNNLINDYTVVLKLSANERKAIIRRMAAELKKREALETTAIAMYIAGDKEMQVKYVQALRSAKYAYLRLNLAGDEVVTSQNARFPVEDALRIFPYMQQMVEHGIYTDNLPMLGHFKVDRIDPDNNDIIVGCHHIKWSEVQRMYTVLTTETKQSNAGVHHGLAVY